MTPRRWVPLVLAVAGLLAVAALASHGHPLSRSHGSGPRPVFFDYVLTTVVILAVVLAAVFVLGLRRTKHGERPRARSRWSLAQMLGTLVLAAILGFGLLHVRYHFGKSQLGAGAPASPTPSRGTHPNVNGARSARIRWDEVAIVAALLAAAGVAAYATRTVRAPKEWRFRSHADVALALDESVDDLRTEPDVRRAIIAAYARMERALSVVGVPRRPAEAPLEYMARVLQQLDAGAPAVARLTDLFERAKFSRHDPDEAMREEAIASLVAVRDELRRPVEVAA